MHKYIITRYRKKSLKYPTLLLSFQLVIASLNTIHIHTQSQIYYHQIKIKNRLIVKVLSLKTETITKTININNKSQLPKFKFIIRAIEFPVNLHYFSDHFITHTDFLLPKTYTIADQ